VVILRHYKFEDWCANAVSGIGFPPDRNRVYWELYHHMEDRYDDFRDRLEPGLAEQAVVEAMGDASLVRKQLAQIHKPFWGYCLRVTRVILSMVLLFTFIPAAKHLWEYYDPYTGPDQGYNIYDSANYGGDTGRTLLMLHDPDISFQDSGFTYDVTDVLVWENSDGEGYLYLCLILSNPRPWALFPDWDKEPLDALYAVDSQGTRYSSTLDRYGDQTLEFMDYVCVTGSQTSPFTREYTICINQIELTNEWVDFIYDRDGRSHVLHIRLPGGDGK